MVFVVSLTTEVKLSSWTIGWLRSVSWCWWSISRFMVWLLGSDMVVVVIVLSMAIIGIVPL